MSDLHYDDTFSVVPLRKAIDMVNGLSPDLVVVTGDFVTAPRVSRRWSKGVRAAKAARESHRTLRPVAGPNPLALGILGRSRQSRCGYRPGVT